MALPFSPYRITCSSASQRPSSANTFGTAPANLGAFGKRAEKEKPPPTLVHCGRSGWIDREPTSSHALIWRLARHPLRPVHFLDSLYDPRPDPAAVHVALVEHGVRTVSGLKRGILAIPLRHHVGSAPDVDVGDH